MGRDTRKLLYGVRFLEATGFAMVDFALLLLFALVGKNGEAARRFGTMLAITLGACLLGVGCMTAYLYMDATPVR